ncbi:MAG: hypothetical protein UX02_C0004G0028 [Candidatus Moranbacteria bacterium GW2011_GWC1_45_18]|nr:MAG: hypothetical protein UT79_C0003G0061 [Candidatus Moranbacteria bacterium GW2011_GWC2_40_12]KKT33282.1 MAG: hypothetical protein UW19_C0010G0023 [Candidatus Moranbacteria bacterium GW2011_GWF2_44_10]KKT99308.1 MAG: hypothetical protein UX02_C0004G0028 [Candidatus Moranbacteria bacterium GW2011_GWC1_45_18]OGI24395.1 MAG: hypothetical protein A2194_04710 [Candidatus Moranbacteria bacterium RIFOXYA1_FULL_44_8]OGI36732.1 MAG: hypothetical protein A2407_02910 [Candidatus Moranbacteria bacteri
MSQGDIENPFRKKGGDPQMGKKKDRIFTDEDVSLLNEMVKIAVRILRNKGVSVEHPEFQERKKEVIGIVFGITEISSKEEQDRFWGSLARRIENTISISPEEHFRRKRARELKDSFDQPENERTREQLDKARSIVLEKRGKGRKKAKVDAAMIRDAVHLALKDYKFSGAKMREAAANVLKYYLCADYMIQTDDPNLKRLSDPSRQRDLF